MNSSGPAKAAGVKRLTEMPLCFAEGMRVLDEPSEELNCFR